MSKKRALITGISGQDGTYLSELLLSKDYEVYGIIRRNASENLETSKIGHLLNDIKLFYGDMTDAISLQNAVIRSRPHEVYNLAAQSHVQISYDNPIYTAHAVAVGYLSLLEAVRSYSSAARVVQASSSEMYGNSIDADGLQRETTPFHPANPYACAKLFAHNVGINYRNSYGMFIANSIAFNHESPLRSGNFVTSKVVREAVKIKMGKVDTLPMGNLSSCRDWGHAKDTVNAIYLMAQHNKPDDWVVSTGERHSVKELCDYVFHKLGMEYKDYVKIDPEFIRPEETRNLCGDSSKLRRELGWKPEYTFESLIDEMIAHYQKLLV